MNRLIEKIAYYCFPELLESLVLLELKNPENSIHQVQSLSWQCIREAIRSRIKPNSQEFVYFKLFFQEDLNILETSQLIRDGTIFEEQFGFTRLITGFNRLLYRKREIQLKYDPHIMRQVLEQNLEREKHNSVTIVVLEKSFRVVLDEDVIVDAPHVCWSTKLAVVFTRICFEKNIRMIQLEVEIKHRKQRVEQQAEEQRAEEQRAEERAEPQAEQEAERRAEQQGAEQPADNEQQAEQRAEQLAEQQRAEAERQAEERAERDAQRARQRYEQYVKQRFEHHAKHQLSTFINGIGLVGPDDEHWESACQHKGNFIYRQNRSFTKLTKEHYSSLSQSFVLSNSESDQFGNQSRIFYLSNNE